MPKLFALAIGVFTALTPYPAWAAASSGPGKITKIYMPASGNLMRVEFDQPIVNPDGCGGGDFYVIELSNSSQDRFVSMIISAFMTGKTVSFWISGCTGGAYWGSTRPLLADVYVDQ